MEMKAKVVALLTIAVVVISGAAQAAFLSPTPGGRTTGTQIGGSPNTPLLPMDAWGWFSDNQDDRWRWEFGTEVLVPRFTIEDKFGRKQVSKHLVHVLPFGSLVYRVNDWLSLKGNLDNPFRLGAAFGKNREQLGFDTQSLVSLTTITALADIKVNNQLHVSVGPVWGFCQEKWHAPFDLNRRPLPIFTDSRASGFNDFDEPGISAGIFVDLGRTKLGLQYVSEIKAGLSGRTEIPLLGIRDKFKSELTFPQTFTLAGSYQLTDKVQLVGDIYYWNYSATSNNQYLDFAKLPLVKPVAIEAQDAFGVHIGGNYTVSKRLAVRAAVGWLSQSVPDHRLDTLTFDVPGYDVALGASWCLSKSTFLNVSWTYAWGESKSHNGDKFSTEINTFGLSFGGSF